MALAFDGALTERQLFTSVHTLEKCSRSAK